MLGICNEGDVTLQQGDDMPIGSISLSVNEKMESNAAEPAENESRVAQTHALPQLCSSACHPAHQQLINDNM